MLKQDLQHQFWVTKKAVQRKLGSKEDECIVSSDAELDSKIDLLKSIGDSSAQLKRIIDSYQDKISILAQEENTLGIFLKESGKNSATSGRAMNCTGKSISYSGQQHMKLRNPLVRLQHEVETFIGRAIKDTYATIHGMERERTEYRAALGWMKAASAQLDPDKDRGLDKFRNAQTYVRTAKTKFDTMTLDCLQKIDLLAAARCNMFSHVLVAYQSALLDFATKTSFTFQAALKILEEKTQYNFTILKDLTQVPVIHDKPIDGKNEMTAIDSDQMLFFKDEFEDDAIAQKTDNNDKIENIDKKIADQKSETNLFDLLDITSSEMQVNQMSTDLLLDLFDTSDVKSNQSTLNEPSSSSSTSLAFDLFKKIQNTASFASNNGKMKTGKLSGTDKPTSAWMDLFADLDPLANPTSMEKKISGTIDNSSAA